MAFIKYSDAKISIVSEKEKDEEKKAKAVQETWDQVKKNQASENKNTSES